MTPLLRLRSDTFARALDGPAAGVLPDEVARLVNLAQALPDAAEAALAPEATMAPQARDRLRNRLVAMAAVQPITQGTVGRPSTQHRGVGQRATGHPRAAAVAAGVMAALLALVGVGWGARHALPGDPLYRLKVAAEDVQLATTSGKIARGERHLSFATERLVEVRKLLAREKSGALGAAPRPGLPLAAGPATLSSTPPEVWAGLGAMSEHTIAGTKDLTEAWKVSGENRPLDILTKYTKGQWQSLVDTVSELPTKDRLAAARPLGVLVLVTDRAERLQRFGQNCDATCRAGRPPGSTSLAVGIDALGAVPCSAYCPDATAISALTPPAPTPGSQAAMMSAALNVLVEKLPPEQNAAPTPTPLQTLPAVGPTPSTSPSQPTHTAPSSPAPSSPAASTSAPTTPLTSTPAPSTPAPSTPAPSSPGVTPDPSGPSSVGPPEESTDPTPVTTSPAPTQTSALPPSDSVSPPAIPGQSEPVLEPSASSEPLANGVSDGPTVASSHGPSPEPTPTPSA
ncbi:MAG: DUF5667 domain-containing protein [Frankiaceae bacterium]